MRCQQLYWYTILENTCSVARRIVGSLNSMQCMHLTLHAHCGTTFQPVTLQLRHPPDDEDDDDYGSTKRKRATPKRKAAAPAARKRATPAKKAAAAGGEGDAGAGAVEEAEEGREGQEGEEKPKKKRAPAKKKAFVPEEGDPWSYEPSLIYRCV